jgi:DHA2 family multidrug resistance protein
MSAPAEGVRWQPRHNPWLIAVVVAMAAFMEVLDTSIANVALPYMAGNLAVSNDESTWVLTSYLVSNAIVLPMSGWLAGLLGRKRFFMACLFVFTLSSLLCGMAPTLPTLLLCRVVQGVGGGGLQPMAQAILADTFPPQQRGLAFALYGITAVLAPTIGPTLGGWITFNYSWRWIFYINLPVGLLALFLVLRMVEDPPYLKRAQHGGIRFDYIGFGLLTLGIGALQVMLDRGEQDDWLGSRFIVMLAVITVVCLAALVIWEWRHSDPIVDVRLFKNFNYASANVMMFTLGVVLFSSLVMIPQFLQTELGYTAELAGLVLSAGAIVLLIEMPLVGQLTRKVQARYMIAFGWLALSIAMFHTAHHVNLFLSFSAAAWLRVMQVVGMGFLFVPITLVSYNGIPPEKNNAAAGMINFMRNIGSSIGTSLVTTMVAQRSQFHQSVITEHVTAGNPGVRAAVEALAQQLARAGMSLEDARMRAYAVIYRAVRGQASTLAYIDTFWVLAVGAAIMFVLSFVLRKNVVGAGGPIAAH